MLYVQDLIFTLFWSKIWSKRHPTSIREGVGEDSNPIKDPPDKSDHPDDVLDVLKVGKRVIPIKLTRAVQDAAAAQPDLSTEQHHDEF